MSKPKSPNTFLVSDESINTYKCRLLSAGGDATAFESNPVMLFMHVRGNVIGRWENIRQEDGNWYADAVFDLEDKRECGGAEIGGKVQRGFLKAASAGVVIEEAVYNEALNCYDVTKWCFQEISIVDVGSNHNALKLYTKEGEPMDELKLAAHLEQFKPDAARPVQEAPSNPTQTSQTISTNSMEIKLVTLALAMGLAETATQDQVLTLAAQGQTAIKELAELKLKVQTEKTNEANRLVDEAVTDHRIPATAKEAYLKLFASDYEAAKTVLAGLAKPQNLLTLTTQNTNQVVTGQKEADAKKYEELDKAGKLLTLAQQDFPQFERLYEAFHGTKPDKIKV